MSYYARFPGLFKKTTSTPPAPGLIQGFETWSGGAPVDATFDWSLSDAAISQSALHVTQGVSSAQVIVTGAFQGLLAYANPPANLGAYTSLLVDIYITSLVSGNILFEAYDSGANLLGSTSYGTLNTAHTMTITGTFSNVESISIYTDGAAVSTFYIDNLRGT